jgi:predicted dienelactone hydrolase
VGPYLLEGRTGVAGFSAGGYTALVLLGAQPDFSLLQGYCTRHPEDREICGLKNVVVTLVSPRPMLASRVRAGFVTAPLGIFFGPGAFEAVRSPVFFAQEDAVLLPDENAVPVRKGLRTLVESRVIPGAGHYVFPCF